MTLSINPAKFYPPGLPAIIERRHLLDRLGDNRDKQLVFVIGQAAQGKSTLVASHLANCRTSVAWLHLDATDGDAVNFYYLMIHAIQHAASLNDLTAFLNYPSMTLGPREEILRYHEWLQTVFALVPDTLDIVLDGIDQLTSNCSAMTFVRRIIAELPAHVRVIILGREAPPLGVQQLKMRRAALVIENNELAFSPGEVRAFFQKIHGLALTEARLKCICRLTDGWVGGVVLLAEALHRLPSEERARYFDELPEKLSQEVFAYFSEEILAAQPDRIQNLLIKASVFETIDPAFMRQLAPDENPARIFSELVRRNLFIQTVHDTAKGRMFRFNQLFRDFLTQKRNSTMDVDAQRSLLLAAAQLYEQYDQKHDSVRFYLQAREFRHAAALIAQVGSAMLKQGRLAELGRWVEALPAEVVASDPWLLFYRAMAQRISGGRQNIVTLQQALELFKLQGDRCGHILALAYLIEASIFLGHHPVPLRQWLEEAETMLQSLKTDQAECPESVVLSLQIGFGHIAGDGDLQKGIAACRSASWMAAQQKDTGLQINATIVSILGLVSAGEFSKANKALAQIGRLIGKRGYPEFRALQNLVKLKLAMVTGDIDAGERYLALSQTDVETYGLLFLYPMWVDAAAMLRIYQGRHNAAEQMATHLSDLAILSNSLYYEGLSKRIVGKSAYFQGRFEEAREHTRSALTALREAGRRNMNYYRIRNLLGLIYLHAGDYQPAERELLAVQDYYTNSGSLVSKTGAHLALGLLYRQMGNDRQAAGHLQEGLTIARQKGYGHLPVMQPEDFARCCLAAVEMALPDVCGFALHLLATRLADAVAAELKARSDSTDVPRRQVARQVSQAIYRANLPFFRIQTLGAFSVRRSTEPDDEFNWEGHRPRALLKAILVQGGRDVPKENLLAALWPDSSVRAAEKTFKVNLHRLRKLLEPQLNAAYGSAYLHLRDNCVSLDPELVRVDMIDYLTLFSTGRQADNRGDHKGALTCFQQAADLYQGDFLPDEPSAKDCDLKRSLLKEKQIVLLSRMGELYESRGAIRKATACYKKMALIDPLLENAYQKQMTIYLNRGMPNAGLKVFEQCRNVLIAEIGAPPGLVTMAIYKKLCDAARRVE